jgi:hypothetical protein
LDYCRYITRLRERIQWLESIVKERCPDVILSVDPLNGHDELPDLGRDTWDENETDVNAAPIHQSESAPATEVPNQGLHQRTGDAQPSGVPHTTIQSSTNAHPEGLSHEIGLVCLGTSQDPKYIGPSSGYFLSRMMLSKSSRRSTPFPKQGESLSKNGDWIFVKELLEASSKPASIDRGRAIKLSATYFDVINIQHPILHQDTFLKVVDHVYNTTPPEPAAVFQVYMVLAISATILSRRLQSPLPAEGYCSYAMKYFDQIAVDGSIQGVQNLLLLMLYAMHTPSVKLNLWYLNYQCIAALIDLGLQRRINANSGISYFEQEMRTRLFWVIYSLDRSIATMMGRPIGLRDEACELRVNGHHLPWSPFFAANMLDSAPRQHR